MYCFRHQHSTLLSYSVPGEDNELLFYLHSRGGFHFLINGTKFEGGIPMIEPYRWHSVCTTWNGKSGETVVYIDGERVASTEDHATKHVIRKGGSFMLGMDQDCVAGCTDHFQQFIGMISNMDVWSSVLNQEEIIQISRCYDGEGDVLHLSRRDDFLIISNDIQIDETKLCALCSTQTRHKAMQDKSLEKQIVIKEGNSEEKASDISSETTGADRESECNENAFVFHLPWRRSKNNWVKITTPLPDMTDMTMCVWMKSTKKHQHSALFSYAVPGEDNEITFYLHSRQGFHYRINDTKFEGNVSPIKPYLWHLLCTTWSSSKGESLVYLDGKVIAKTQDRFAKGHVLRGGGSLMLGAEQDCKNGCTEANQQFVGSFSSFGVWSYVLEEESINKAWACRRMHGNVLQVDSEEGIAKGSKNVRTQSTSWCLVCRNYSNNRP